MSKLGAPIFDFDARAFGHEMKIPIFVIQGRDDHVVSFDAARDFVRDVRAPSKALIPIDGGHFALFTNPNEFVGALQGYVRPGAR